MKKKRKYWYFQTIYYCPMCCKERTYRHRVYTKKPKDYMKRIKIIESWDYCGVF